MFFEAASTESFIQIPYCDKNVSTNSKKYFC